MKVWINGCFDVLHYGHFKMISFARSFSNNLIVGIDSDSRVRKNKGINRPFHNQNKRKFNLQNIKGIEKVYIFKSDYDLEKILKKEKPDIMIIGDEYKNKKVIGKKFVKKVIYFKKLKNISTTKILK